MMVFMYETKQRSFTERKKKMQRYLDGTSPGINEKEVRVTKCEKAEEGLEIVFLSVASLWMVMGISGATCVSVSSP